jgi:hypothetical protein
MTCELTPTGISDEQKRQVLGVLSVGCDRQTAAHLVGCTIGQIAGLVRQDRRFAADMNRTEAAAEVNHMRAVHDAAKDAKNWRASVWWLERRAPERYGQRGTSVVTARQLKAFTEMFAEILIEEIHDSADRERLIGRLGQLIARLDQQGLEATLGPSRETSSKSEPPQPGDEMSDERAESDY